MICVVLAHFVRGLDALSDQQTTDASNRPFSTICWLCSKQHISHAQCLQTAQTQCVCFIVFYTAQKY